MTGSRAEFRDIEIVAPNLNRRFSGVTSTVIALLPHQAKAVKIAALGYHIPGSIPRVGWRDILIHGWGSPVGRPFRIWHARRNIEMIAGVLLRDLFRQPWKLVFTSAAQRNHTSFTKRLIRRMDAVIATSPQAAGFLEVPCTVIMHGVDLDRYRPAPDRAAAWAEAGLPGRYGIGAFGRVRHQKGTDLFVEAMCRLLPHHPDFTAVIIGLATPDNQSFQDGLKDTIQKAGLADRIVFLGELPAGDVPDWFRRLLIHAAPQRWEGFGLTPLEAMASGSAVVASHAGVFAALVEDGRTGILTETGDLESLVAGLDRLMKNPALAEDMGAAGRKRAESSFAISGEAERINAIYAGL